MGRKIEIKRIENYYRRLVTFTKRRNLLIKQSKDLSILCDVEVALIFFSNNGKVYDFSTGCMEQLLSRYGYSPTTAVHGPKEQQQLLVCSSQEDGALLRENESTSSELERLHLAIERLKGNKLDGMSLTDLTSLESLLNDSLHSVKEQKTQILLNQVERSRLQEKRVLKENRHLRKQVVEMMGRGSSGPPKPLSEIPQVSSSQAEPESSSSEDGENNNEELQSDTSLQLGLSSSEYCAERKKPEIESPCDNYFKWLTIDRTN